MWCHIINKHRHKVEIKSIDIPLCNIYLVESEQTIKFGNPMNLLVFCPTCKMQSYPETSYTICPAREYIKYYNIDEFSVQGTCWWCPCMETRDSYLEICAESGGISRNISQNFVLE
jgi:hypothetical protein